MEVSVLVAKTIGIYKALSWVVDRTDNQVCIESDSLTAVQAIIRGTTYRNYIPIELGHVFD